MELAEFLRAQLDEDVRLIDEYERYMAERAGAAGSFVPVVPPGWQSGEPFDPDRQRAEVDAKRRILDEHKHYDVTGGFGCGICAYNGRDGVIEPEGWCTTVRLLVLPYAEHPNYDQSWRP